MSSALAKILLPHNPNEIRENEYAQFIVLRNKEHAYRTG